MNFNPAHAQRAESGNVRPDSEQQSMHVQRALGGNVHPAGGQQSVHAQKASSGNVHLDGGQQSVHAQRALSGNVHPAGEQQSVHVQRAFSANVHPAGEQQSLHATKVEVNGHPTTSVARPSHFDNPDPDIWEQSESQYELESDRGGGRLERTPSVHAFVLAFVPSDGAGHT